MARFTLFWILLILLGAVNSHAQEDTPDYRLLVAASDGDENGVLNALLDSADVNAVTAKGVTPLMYAVQEGYTDIAKILINNGANVNARPDNGITPLISASRFNRLDIAALLLQNGADIKTKNRYDATPLMYAAAYGYDSLALLLILNGASVNDTALYGETPLDLAAISGNPNVVNILLHYGANVNSRDEYGFTPLISASQEGFAEASAVLLEKGADIAAKSNNGASALCTAIYFGHYGQVELLLNKGADVNEKISPSMTPLALADLNFDTDMRRLLKSYGAKKNLIPVFSQMKIGVDLNFNSGDFFWGIHTGFVEAKNKLELSAGFDARITSKKILEEQTLDFYYQYREKRSLVYLDLVKKMYFKLNLENDRLGFYIGIKEIYTFGKYRGLTQKVADKFITVPQAGLFLENVHGILKAGYERMDFETFGLSPHRIIISYAVYIDLQKNTIFKKELSWI